MIDDLIEDGLKIDEIYEILLAHGYKIEDIDRAMESKRMEVSQ